MLSSLYMENIAVIREASVDFGPGLCVLTGETGAGKSLLIDSINCLTGGRISRDLIRTGTDRATVSALFTPPKGEVAAALAELGLDLGEGEELMLQRTITRDGRTTARINGRAVTQAMLREVGGLLINIHGQSDNQKLMQVAAHGHLLDAYSSDATLASDYRATYEAFRAIRSEMERLRQDESERLRTREMLEFQIRDIDAARLRPGEEEKLTERRDRLLHLEKINRQVTLACRALSDGEKSTVMSLCDRAEAALGQIASIIPECDGLMERVAALRAEAEDIAEHVRAFGDEDMGDPTAELDKLEGRLDAISRLARKYGPDIPAILAFREKAAERLSEIETADDRIAAYEAQLKVVTKRLSELAEALTAGRQAAGAELSARVMESLSFLDMPKVRFEVDIRPLEDFGPDGADRIEFLIASNPGDPLGPLVKIASGGELSRIMLAIRSVLNERYGVPTAIYDEVDTGISGRTARKVGIKLSDMAAPAGDAARSRQQIICVTHSAQIASLADAHYVIEKHEVPDSEGNLRAETSVRFIDDADRVEEIARILGGLHITDAQRVAAEELIKRNEGNGEIGKGEGKASAPSPDSERPLKKTEKEE